MTNIKKQFLPETKLGKWTLGSIGIFFLCMAVSTLVSALLSTEARISFWGNLAVGIPAVIGMMSGMSALVLGVITTFKKQDRTISVSLATLIGLLLFIFLLCEFIMPH